MCLQLGGLQCDGCKPSVDGAYDEFSGKTDGIYYYKLIEGRQQAGAGAFLGSAMLDVLPSSI
jgi:hypothetical protein